MSLKSLKKGRAEQKFDRIGRAALVAAAICVAAALPSRADKTISENTTLTEDTDWRDQGVVTIAEGVTLNLNGYTLRVSALAGAGSIVDSKSYELLDYVEATGKQYFTTGYVPGVDTNGSTILEIVATPTSATSMTLFGTDGWGTGQFLGFGSGGNWHFYGSGRNSTGIAPGVMRRFLVVDGMTFLLDPETGAEIGVTTGQSWANNNGKELIVCGLVANDNGNRLGKYKIHSFKVWHGDVMQFDFVPARHLTTGEVGLLDRLEGKLYTCETETAFLCEGATAVGTLGAGELRVEAASDAALSGFTGTVGANVRLALDGECTLAANADWKRFGNLSIDGTVELAGHDLSLAGLRGTGTVSDYEVLTYVEATNAQRICTGIVPGPDTAVELDMTHLVNDNGNVLFGCDSWSTYRYMLVYASSKPYFFGEINKCCNVLTTDTRYLITLSPTTSPNGTVKFVVKHTEAAHGSFTASFTYGGNSELCLFGLGDGTRMSKYRLHSFKITKGGDLKRDFVPVRHAKTGAVGLFDKVSGQLFTSDTGVELVAGPVSTEAEKLGKLHVDIGEGCTEEVNFLSLAGGLALVKEGAGTLAMNHPLQTYSGGTRVSAGTVETKVVPRNNRYAATQCFLGLTGSTITVGSGAGGVAAVFDFKGNVNYRWYTIMLNGGALRNGGRDQSASDGSLGHLTLTADSTIETAFNTTVFHATTDLWNLNTHTLSVETLGKTLYFRDSVIITNGVFWTKGNGCWQTVDTVKMRGATLRAESPIWLGAQLDVENYYAACTTDSNNGTAAMNVYGRFTPATDYFYGCTLQDGATIDLNGHSGAWSTTSAFTGGANRVTFATGATITIDGHERSDWTGKILDWGEGSAPADVTFKLDDASKAMGRNLYMRDRGLYATDGVMIIIR